MILGYNTNGFANHDCLDALGILSEIGYRSIALTVDHHCLNPITASRQEQRADVAKALQDHGLRSCIETGARFLLDPWNKHEPTLMSKNRERRIDFYRYCIELAHDFKSDCVSIWSGTLRDDLEDEAALERLADGLGIVLREAEQADVLIGFEPEPGMFIDTTSRFQRLKQWVDSTHLKLTMDVGHLYCLHEVPIADYLHRSAAELVNVHIEDMRSGVHEHLMFGEGEMNFPPIIEALSSIGYQGGVHVELSRHSHQAPSAARQAFEFLHPLLSSCSSS